MYIFWMFEETNGVTREGPPKRASSACMLQLVFLISVCMFQLVLVSFNNHIVVALDSNVTFKS